VAHFRPLTYHYGRNRGGTSRQEHNFGNRDRGPADGVLMVMHRFLAISAASLVVVSSAVAAAQEAVSRQAGLPARVGFQTAVRTGYSIPMGKQRDVAGADMSNNFTGQVPLFFEMGGKPSPYVFLGGYLGLGFGRAAGTLQENCGCSVFSLHIGVEAQAHLLPAATTNPWIGFGIGFESISTNTTSSVTMTGVEYARFMAGVDFRLDPVFGVGPFIDLSLGQYSQAREEASGQTIQEASIQNQGIHEWLSLGVRGVFFP
jgi:hypothetical protein